MSENHYSTTPERKPANFDRAWIEGKYGPQRDGMQCGPPHFKFQGREPWFRRDALLRRTPLIARIKMRRVHESGHVACAPDRRRSTLGRICQAGASGQGARLILQPTDLTLLQRSLLLLLQEGLYQCLVSRQT